MDGDGKDALDPDDRAEPGRHERVVARPPLHAADLLPAQMIHLGRSGTPLIRDVFVARAEGPVSPVSYERLRAFGTSPVTDVLPARLIGCETLGHQSLADAYSIMRHKTPGQMVRMVQGGDGAWACTFRRGARPRTIPTLLMLEEYQARVDRL